MLEDHTNPAAQCDQPGFGQIADVMAIDQHAARGRTLQPVDGADQTGLAGARPANDAEDLSGADVEVDPVKGADIAPARAIGLAQPLEPDAARAGMGARGLGNRRNMP